MKKRNERSDFPFGVCLPASDPHPVSEGRWHGIPVVGSVSEDGHTVLPAEEYAEEDDVYDDIQPQGFDLAGDSEIRI